MWKIVFGFLEVITGLLLMLIFLGVAAITFLIGLVWHQYNPDFHMNPNFQTALLVSFTTIVILLSGGIYWIKKGFGLDY